MGAVSVALLKKIGQILRDERGATVIEYGLILALLALAIIAAMTSVGVETMGALERANDGW